MSQVLQAEILYILQVMKENPVFYNNAVNRRMIRVFFQTRPFGGKSGKGRIVFLCERNAPRVVYKFLFYF